jgi:isocitrate/isopropylmalate dehydrogenase
MNEEETTYFTQPEREKAKAQASPETLIYIEALERIARYAFDLWATRGMEEEAKSADDLYDALLCVNFMQEEE